MVIEIVRPLSIPARTIKRLLRVPRKLRVRKWAKLLESSSDGIVWYTDKYEIENQISQGENLDAIVGNRSHYDDPGVINLLQRLIKPGMVVFDVGANKGDFTLHCIHLLGQSGHIVAFEPISAAYEKLLQALQRDPAGREFVRCERLAVSNSSGTAVFHTYPIEFSGWNGLGDPKLNPNYSPYMKLNTEVVTIITLDEYCAQNDVEQIDLLKIDVEGFEIEVIEGAQDLIAAGAIRHLIFEISLAPLAGAHHTAKDVLHSFEDMGFEVSLILPNGLLQPVNSAAFNAPFFANYLASPNSRHEDAHA